MNSINPLTRCSLLGFVVFLGGSLGLEAKDSLEAGRIKGVVLGKARDWKHQLSETLEAHCYDCHGDGARKGGLAMDELSNKLDDPAVFAKWEQIFDRVDKGEMPPAKVKDRPTSEEISLVRKNLGQALFKQHALKKGTVLR
ncbi:MAG: c-type cytochrome domain-containing protein, partial [Opitutales bacterium]